MIFICLILVGIIIGVIIIAIKADAPQIDPELKAESVIPDELTNQIEACQFHLSFAEMIELPKTKIEETEDGICAYEARLPNKELGIFDELLLTYFPQSETHCSCWKIKLIGSPPVTDSFLNFVKMTVWKQGAAYPLRAELDSWEIEEINEGREWRGREWCSKEFAMKITFDVASNKVELSVGNPIYESSLENFYFEKWDRSEFTEKTYSIVGMKHRRVSKAILESFLYGYMKLEPRNEFDPHAIAVFNNDNRKIGYISKHQNYELYTIMMKNPKKIVEVIGQIWNEVEYDGYVAWKGELAIRGYRLRNA